MQITAESVPRSQSSFSSQADSTANARLNESDVSTVLTDTAIASGKRRLLAKHSPASRSAADIDTVDSAVVDSEFLPSPTQQHCNRRQCAADIDTVGSALVESKLLVFNQTMALQSEQCAADTDTVDSAVVDSEILLRTVPSNRKILHDNVHRAVLVTIRFCIVHSAIIDSNILLFIQSMWHKQCCH